MTFSRNTSGTTADGILDALTDLANGANRSPYLRNNSGTTLEAILTALEDVVRGSNRTPYVRNTTGTTWDGILDAVTDLVKGANRSPYQRNTRGTTLDGVLDALTDLVTGGDRRPYAIDGSGTTINGWRDTLTQIVANGGIGTGRPDAPVLTLTSGSTVNAPTFSIAFTDLVPAGSVLSFQSAGDSAFTSPTTTNHTVTTAEAAANTVVLGLSALADGTYWFRCNITVGGITSAWSNSQTETIAAVPTLSSPLGTQTGTTTASLSVTTDKSSGTLYWVVSTSATPPSVAQIEAGHDSTGSAAAASGNQAVLASGSQSASATGLTQATVYYAYFVHQNTPGGSNVAAAASFATQGLFVGPGDINGAGYQWGGLRAFNALYAAALGPAVDVVDQAGANATTINVTSAGDLDGTAIAAWVAAHSVTTIRVSKLYDQTGNSRHLTQATLASMPVLVQSPSGLGTGKWAMQFNHTSSQLSGAGFVTLGTTGTVSIVADNTGSGSQRQLYFFDNNAVPGIQVNANGGANSWGVFGQFSFTGAVADNAFHAAQNLTSPTASTLYIDGTNQSFSTTNPTINGTIQLGNLFGSFFGGFVTEVGIWASDKTVNDSAMNSNQHSYWGF